MMILAEAEHIAHAYRERLRPYCERIEIAGSIRRRRPTVKDIELVAIPKKTTEPDGFFDTRVVVHSRFCQIVNQLEKVKGEPTGKYTQRRLPEGIALDLFIAEPDNWGYIFAIRTGSADFSFRVLASTWKRRGFKGERGFLTLNGERVVVREEPELFRLLGLDYVEPYLRNTGYATRHGSW